MSTYHSTQTGHAPGGFNITHPTRHLDVAYNIYDPGDIRTTLKTNIHTNVNHLNTQEARELATRILIAIATPQHIIDDLIELQEQSGAAKETHW